ncbi:MAG: hypothetical protein A3K19_03380 [Lentisphaerae bacterium RIFOXYB12_FULL_65_16]|nr:MAG: hypothetical protein A3K18_33175 [Lentisphaerae bacterium RIFOXYA12_64_32]OGV92216.1 MAG: hypothetical protein A3K19_03380 [Lentisphaerae bacterium RIFOXYB12_FULL_65_16]
MNSLPDNAALPLQPLPYHDAMVAYLRTYEDDLWTWFSSAKVRTEQADAVRLDLLKNAYRMGRDTQPDLYAAADAAAAALGLSVPATVYQLQGGLGMNASLAYIPGEIHVVLQGPVLATLNAVELRSLLGHEFAHFLFYEYRDRQFHTAAEVLAAMTRDRKAEPPHAESARLYQLYTEVFCDRGALRVGGDLAAAVAMQVKIETGLREVSATDYLRQADEIFRLEKPRTEELTHPESFIRARALQLWSAQGDAAAAEIARMLEGPPSLESLDLLGKMRVSDLTRRVIGGLLAHTWLRTDSTLAHARRFFDDFTPAAAAEPVPALAAEIQGMEKSLKEYFCYVLLDFATVDRSLEDAPLAAALEFSRKLGLGELFGPIATKELGLKKKQFEKLSASAAELLEKAATV